MRKPFPSIRFRVSRTALFLGLSVLLFAHCVSRDEKEPAPLYTEGQRLIPAQTVSQTLTDDTSMQDEITVSRENALTRAIAHVSPAVVGISVKQQRRVLRRDPFWEMFLYETVENSTSLGSGFLISPDGYILTNEHVVGEEGEISITTTDGQTHTATRVGLDKQYDVALLKIDGVDFPFIPLGNSDDVIIGEWAIALGNPFGLFDVSAKPTVTVGVISAVDMDFRNAFEGRSYTDMIQTDASINGGNSGGPLVNGLGEVVAINTFIFTGDNYSKGSVGIGFAIPINRVKRILPDLKTIGHIDRSFTTGLEVRNISQLVARMKNISTRDGVIVTRVERQSPADKAGIKEGDIVVQIDSQRIRSASDAQAVINTIDITETSSVEVWVYRDGDIKKLSMTIQPSQSEEAP